jgi:CMP-N,N'-diacetyllegionaminic acid synthase
MSEVVAIIPARSGSKSVTDKNIKTLAGHPLLSYSIAAARLSKHISRVIVSTDSEQYASIARQYGAEVPFLRPGILSTDEANDRDFLLHAMKCIRENESNLPEIWVHLRPTTPLREITEMDKALELFLVNPKASSLRSAHPAPESPIKWFVKNGEYFQGFVDNELSNCPKEMFEQTYVPNGYIDIVRASVVMKNKNIHGDKMLSYISPVVNEVDSLEEFQYIEFQLTRHDFPIRQYLDTVKK